MDEVAYFKGNDDRLICRHVAQSFAVEMIEVRVRDQNEVDRWKIVQTQAGMPDSLDNFEPLRPVGVDEETLPTGLHKE